MEQVAFPRSEREHPPIDIGWVLDARLDDLDRRAVLEAVETFDRLLASHLPGFDWRSATRTRELVQAAREEPVVLLEAGALELALDHWDFAFVVTGSDLVSHYRPSTVAVPSRALGVTVLSTFHLDPRVRSAEASAEERSRLITRRVTCLAMCSLGHLLGLPRSREPDNFMTEVDPTELDPERACFSDQQREELLAELARVADERVEEERGVERTSSAAFQLRAAWRNRREIVDSLGESRWWQFPFRMGRLSTAALSALIILLATSETWEIAGQLPVWICVLLGPVSIAATAWYVLMHQRLLSLPGSSRLTEQAVVTRVLVGLFVTAGMTLAFVLVAAVATVLSASLFGAELVGRWSGGAAGSTLTTYAAEVVFTSALAVLVGALGASFEGQNYVRHMAYVDDEL